MKVTQEEFEKIKEIRQQGVNFINEFGKLKMDELIIKKRSEDLIKKYDIFSEEEKKFFDLLAYKYGKVNIDIETGEITEYLVQS